MADPHLGNSGLRVAGWKAGEGGGYGNASDPFVTVMSPVSPHHGLSTERREQERREGKGRS